MRNIAKVAFLLILVWCIQSCEKQQEIPKELKFSFEYLTKEWNAEELENFKNDSMSIGKYHFSVGMHVRNNLLRHHEKSDELISFFDALGIHHLDDMSAIILTSYHKYLNKENIELQSQVEECIAYWKPIMECEKKMKKKAAELYSSFKLGDSIQIKIPVNNNNGIDYDCPNIVWEFKKAKDLFVKGVIIKKYTMYDDTVMLFDVKILSKNYTTIQIFSREANVGDELRIRLLTAWKIEKIN